MDLSTLDFAELLQLKNDVDVEVRRREVEEKAKAKKQILEIAKAYGFSVEDVLGGKVAPTASGRKPVEVKYRHPNDESLTWTGRGRKPLWVVALLDSGIDLDSLRV
ncbi:KorB protein [Vogesella sp. EB]|mgnify:FL=1|jgi:DNA-binding protein H-NS|uniref:DNA-binding protein H-NS n=2 Tax=Vogesella TaxID=57739 RepID=A0A495B7S0_VOGIN|nr:MULTISPECIES: H-NS histone family protein [Vogesella]KMJ52921.1 KorB protein [Vogesella sp. EB]MCQ4144619.1 H-NS histone family protein [Vogesella sp. AC12]MDC7696532.1 H-NS histone family protein [Vogesella indigofera]MDC7707538.1 H-NS histone family protein [Vogesella indigofera]MDC7710675.1 H-NS histone family protein [Vogesella indigofera]